MKKIITSCMLLLAGNFFAAAQTKVFQKTFDGGNHDYGFSVITTTDGGYAMTGFTESFSAGDDDMLLIRLDSDANVLWSQTYGGSANDQAYKLVQTTDGGFAICGKSASYGAGNYDVALIKTDSAGNLQWMKTYGGASEDRALNFRQTSDNGFLLSGSTYSFGQGDWDALLIKTDVNGDTLWTRIFGGALYDQGTDAAETSDGGFILTGRVSSWGSGVADMYLVKTDVNGDTLWTRVFGDIFYEEGQKVKQTFDGGYIVTGSAKGFGNGSYDVYLNKIDTAGHLAWSKVYAGDADEATYDVLQLADSGFMLVGETESFGSNHLRHIKNNSSGGDQKAIQPDAHFLGDDNSNVYAIRTDANGDTLWTHVYGGGLMDEGFSVVQTPDNGFAIAAFSTSFGNDSTDFYLIKTDSMGYSSCNEDLGTPVVLAPATIEMNTTTQIVSGLSVSTVLPILPPAPINQNNLCFLITGANNLHAEEPAFTLYPNPCSETATLAIPQQYSHAEVFVHDVYGRLITNFSAAEKATISFPVKNFSAGVYEVRVLLTGKPNGEKISFVRKMVVQ